MRDTDTMLIAIDTMVIKGTLCDFKTRSFSLHKKFI
jgi:hypothetical protein